MPILSEHAVFIFVAQIGVILFVARIFGDIAQRFDQPIIVGEVIAGIVLGPAVFGQFLPELRLKLFPIEGYQPYLLQAVSWLCVFFLLMITGLEIDLRSSLKQGKQSIYISILALLFCLFGVFAATGWLPDYVYPDGVNRLHVNILTTIALSVVAIPVIAKILFDLKIMQSEVGLKIITSGVLSDVWGWSLLAISISLISGGEITFINIVKPLITMALYLGFTLTIGHKIVNKAFDIIGYRKMDTSVVLSLLFSLALINGAIAHLLGIHVIFGAFVAGIMSGESDKISASVRQWTTDFIFAVFAPIFFVNIGMQLNFSQIKGFTPILLLLLVSSLCRIGGAYIGAMFSGLGRKNAFAVACGLNTQGTMGVIVALIGFEMGVFNESMFSIIVIICVITSLGVGPLLKWAIKGVRRPLAKYFDVHHIFLNVEGDNKRSVFRNIAELMASQELISNPDFIEKSLWAREHTLSTGIGNGVALPHARIPNLEKPIVCFFRLKNRIDFGSPDDVPVNLLFLELTDSNDDGMQLNLIAQVARFISTAENRKRLLWCTKESEILHILSFDEKA